MCLPNLLGSMNTGIYVISMEDAKLQNLIVEPVLQVTTQSFALFVYKIKYLEAER